MLLLKEFFSFFLLICPFLLPFGAFGIIETFKENKNEQITVLFILKQLFDNLILWFPVSASYVSFINQNQLENTILKIFIILIPVFIAFSILYYFRAIYKNSFSPWFLMFGDVLCWYARIIFSNDYYTKNVFNEVAYIFLAIYTIPIFIFFLFLKNLSKRTSSKFK